MPLATDQSTYRRVIYRSALRMLSPRAWKSRLVFWGGALAVGAIAALFADAGNYAIDLFHYVPKTASWLPFLACPAGLMAVLWLTRHWFPGTEGSGIPQAIAALETRSETWRTRLLSLRIAFGKILLTFLGLLSGASIGREGPTVHVGASIMYSLGRITHFSRRDLERGLILAGGAAGVAAAFNTPIAGIIFAIEEMSRSFEERTSGTMLIAVILAGVTAVAIKGNYTYFGSTSATLGFSGWPLVFLCGIGGGMLGGIFSVVVVHGARRIAPLIARHPYRIAAIAGLFIATAGLLSHATTYGTGYQEAKGILTSGMNLGMFFPFLKIIASIASYLSGIPGGIFAPSLAAGAGLGADLAHYFPSVPTAAVVVLGMVSYFSGVVQTPITAFVIVTEMTDNQSMLFPLMTASLLAYATSRMICHVPIYRALAHNFREPSVNTAIENASTLARQENADS